MERKSDREGERERETETKEREGNSILRELDGDDGGEG